MSYPEPTLTCISYSSIRPLTFTWMTFVSLPPAAGARLHLHRPRRQPRHQQGHPAAALLLTVISKPVAYHLGQTPETPALPVSITATRTPEPSHYKVVRLPATALLINSSRR